MRHLNRLAACALAALALAGYSWSAAPARSAAAPAASAPSAGTLYVSVSGPTEAVTRWTCTWQAYVSGGTAPYTYHWSASGLTETESYDNLWRGYPTVGGNVALEVLVTDATGKSAWGHLIIESSNNAQFCTD